jgi:thiol-disulfide isomerase/thioredoxin
MTGNARLSRRQITAMLGALGLAAVPWWQASARSADTGPAPDFTLPVRGGGSQTLSELQGDVVMLNFWATWCAPCRQEMPLLDQIYQRYQRLGFTLLGVNVEQDTRLIDRFLGEISVSFPILLDTREDTGRMYSVQAMPTTILVDRKGQLRDHFFGYRPGDESKYQDAVRALIRER